MKPAHWISIALLVAGIPLAAWGLAEGRWWAAIAGLALVLAFVYRMYEAMQPPPRQVPKSDNPAWAMRDAPPPDAPPPPPDALRPPPSPERRGPEA